MATAVILEADIIPETNVSAEAPVKASFWQRAKNRALDIAKRIASPVKSAAVKTASTIKRTTKAIIAKVRAPKSDVPEASRLWRVRRAADSATTKVVSWIRDTWNRVLKPFLRLRVVAFGIVFAVVALIASPLTTMLVVFGVGAALWGLSYLVEHLESSTTPAARFALKSIEFAAQFIKGLVYVAAFALTIALCAVSAVFAATEILELVLRYFDVKNAVLFSSVAYFVLTGNWAFLVFVGLMSMATRMTRKESVRPRSVDTQTVTAPLHNKRTQIPVVKADDSSASRRVKLPKCTACGVDDGGARYGLRNHKGICGECFKKLDEEDALKAAKKGKLTKADLGKMREAGVKVPAKVVEAVNNQPINRRVALSLEEISKLSAVENSRDDISKVHWAETAWWYDRNGTPHVREWLGFVDGKSVAAVEYQHEKANRGYAAWMLAEQKDNDRKVGVFHTLTKAHEVLADELSDQANLIGGMLDALREEMPAAEPAKVLEFVEVNEFESPEAHIEHVRKTKGDAAADELENQYLQSMLADSTRQTS